MLKKTDKILIAGQEGLVGSAIYRILKKIIIKLLNVEERILILQTIKKYFHSLKKKNQKL